MQHTKEYRRDWYHKNRRYVLDHRKKWLESISHGHWLWRHARIRASKKGLPFSITKEDVVVPKQCPVLGIRLKRNKGHWRHNSASLDRVIPSRGYVPGNIIVVSFLANAIKQTATPEQIRKVADFYGRTRQRKLRSKRHHRQQIPNRHATTSRLRTSERARGRANKFHAANRS